jgi:hypothetical protein
MVDQFLTTNPTGGTDLKLVTPLQTSAGSGSAGKIPALNSAGQIDNTMLPSADVVSLPATEAIAAGALINIWSSSGVASIRNADNTSAAKMAHGWSASAITSGSSGNVNVGDGQNSSVSALTIGTTYYLGTAGAVVSTPPSAGGTVVQRVGVAQSATLLQVMLDGPTIQQ